jgi:hypothetical protein
MLPPFLFGPNEQWSDATEILSLLDLILKDSARPAGSKI